MTNLLSERHSNTFAVILTALPEFLVQLPTSQQSLANARTPVVTQAVGGLQAERCKPRSAPLLLSARPSEGCRPLTTKEPKGEEQCLQCGRCTSSGAGTTSFLPRRKRQRRNARRSWEPRTSPRPSLTSRARGLTLRFWRLRSGGAKPPRRGVVRRLCGPLLSRRIDDPPESVPIRPQQSNEPTTEKKAQLQTLVQGR